MIVFLGAPGVGKGTQASLLSRRKGWKHISTGDLLREAVAAETPLGLRARDAMDKGDLVGDDVILGLIEEALCDRCEGVVLDGFPRNLEQARALDTLLGRQGRKLNRVVLLTADEDEVVQRLSLRGRPDDTPETVRHRLRVFEERTAPLVGYYRDQSLLCVVDGVGGIDQIQERIEAALCKGRSASHG